MSTAFSKHLGGAPNSGGESGKSLEKLSQPLGRDVEALGGGCGRVNWIKSSQVRLIITSPGAASRRPGPPQT